MKQKIFVLIDSYILKNAENYGRTVPLDGSIECVYRNAKVSKTLAQLGVLFGLWIKELQHQQGADGWSADRWHMWLKHRMLLPIIQERQEGPNADRQAEWFELLEIHLERGNQEGIQRQVNRLSLAWASIGQMKEYLDKVWEWAIDAGFALSVPDKFHKIYEAEVNR